VLLQDGGVVEGSIAREGEWYTIARGTGQMQVAATRVLFVGRSLHEAYEYRLAHATQPTGDSHLNLAEWCLRYNLADEADLELDNAHQLGASAAKISLLDRRLEATRYRLAQKPTPQSYPVVQASAEQTAPADHSHELPNGALEMFTRKVQPVLVNSCTLAKCHEPGGAQSFQLNRAILRGESNRRTTMQNLNAALTLIDREHPEASALLTIPRQTHGGMAGPVFGARQEQAFKHLADWVALIAPPRTSPAEGEGLPEEAPGISHKIPGTAESPNNAASTNVIQAVHTEDAFSPANEAAGRVANGNQADSSVEAPKSLRAPHRLRYGGATNKAWQPRDLFDPEIFNRGQSAQMATQSTSGDTSSQPSAPQNAAKNH
jgi:hypothetical protein